MLLAFKHHILGLEVSVNDLVLVAVRHCTGLRVVGGRRAWVRKKARRGWDHEV